MQKYTYLNGSIKNGNIMRWPVNNLTVYIAPMKFYSKQGEDLKFRKMVMEKQSKHFQFRFCPVCGYDYVQQKEFDGKLYKAPFSVNKLPKSQVYNNA